MDILEHAIQLEGGVSKLARALGVRPNVVSNWRLEKRELPHAWRVALTAKYSKRKAKESA